MSNSGMYGVTPPSSGDSSYQLPQGINEKKLRNELDQMRQLQLRIGNVTGAPGGYKPRELGDLGTKYQKLYDKWSGKGVDLGQYGEFGTYDPLKGAWNPYQAPQSATGEPMNPAESAGQPTVEDVTANPFGPTAKDYFSWLDTKSLPPGVNINDPNAAKTLEVMGALARDAYNIQQQQEGVGTAAKSLDEYKNDPLFQKMIAGMTDKLANPFTFDEQTVNLMRNQASDTLANQEAASGERLRSLGATSGIDPSSPLYASMAQQASLARDLGQQQMERDLQIQKALQDQNDWYRAFSAGGQLAGSYQTGLGQRYAGLTGAQLGGKFQDLGNPFAGLWQGLLMEDQLNQNPGFMETWGPLIGSGIQAAGQVGSAYLQSKGTGNTTTGNTTGGGFMGIG